MKLEKGYVYNTKYGKLIFVGKIYDGDITGFGNTKYMFADYREDIDIINIEDIHYFDLRCSEHIEDVLGDICLDDSVIPFNIEYRKQIIEDYIFTKKKPKIIYE